MIIDLAIKAREAMPDGWKLTLETTINALNELGAANNPELRQRDSPLRILTPA